MGDTSDTWHLAEGDAITAELTAMRRLGGGSAYEAYLAFDELTFAPVVVKVVRPSRVADEGTLRGLRREVTALATVNHPVVVRGLRHQTRRRAAAPGARADRRATAVDPDQEVRAAAAAAVPPARHRGRRRRCTTCATSAGRTWTSSPAT